MTGLMTDLRFALRVLAAKPAHTVAMIATLALAIGANAAIFSVVEAVLLRPLPYPDADRIVTIWATRGADREASAQWPDVEQWRAQAGSFETIGAMRGQSVNLTGTATPDRIAGMFVSADVFTVLGAHPLLGRLFANDESTPGRGREVVVLSHALWTSRFGADPGIVGKSITLDGRPHTIVGVMAAGLTSPFGGDDVWLPITSVPYAEIFERGHPNVWGVARLAPGRTLADAQTELDAISARLAGEFPATNKNVGALAVSLRDQVAGNVRASLLTLLAAVLVVLLIACANIASLQLSRAVSREREMSLRTALGARRSRIVRQLLTESLLVCSVAGALGLFIAAIATRMLAATIDDNVPVYGAVDLDGAVVAFVFALTFVTTLVCGISPAWHAARTGARNALAQRAPDGAGGTARRTLVVAELALSLVLLVGAGLLARTIERLDRVEPGFAPSNLLTFQFRLPQNRYENDAKRTAFFEKALGNVRGVAGVSSAAMINLMPFTGNWGTVSYQTDRSEVPPSTGGPSAQSNRISDAYFQTMQIPLLSGRDFDVRDRADGERVAIVNAEFARREFPEGSAIGHRVRPSGDDADGAWLTIAGVVGNAKQLALTDAPTPQVYMSIRQYPDLFCNIVARTTGDPLASAAAIRAAIWSVDKDQPVWSVHSMDELLARSTSRLRLTTTLGGAFAGAGLLLALIGIYGVMSFMVAQRTREVGIRIAVGAKPGQVVAMVLRDGMRLTAVAIVAGWITALGATRLLASQLFGVQAIDPPTYLAIAAMLAVVALLACWIPARRAARVDPNVALRYE